MSTNSKEYLAHFPELSHTALQKFVTDRRLREKIQANKFFLIHYKQSPCLCKCPKVQLNSLFHIKSILNYLKEQYQHNIANDIIQRKYHQRSKQFYVSSQLCNLGNGIMIYIKNILPVSDVENPNKYSHDLLDDYYLVSNNISIYYLPPNEIEVQNMAKQFLEMSVFTSKIWKMKFICKTQEGGYCLKSIKIKKPMISDLALHYGENFLHVHNKIIKELNVKDGKGIVLLHGIPGSGKTHYIRYLIEEIESKPIIYISPDMAKDISKPEFLAFLLTHPNSIIIIEDAENIIRDRNSITFDASQAVANLLNISDGLLSDAMHMQIIATFNCDIGIIDRALLRKGRLIAIHQFGKLDVTNARILSDKLGFGIEHISLPMTLAEIYNQEIDNKTETIV